jgi:hypothetical protein
VDRDAQARWEIDQEDFGRLTQVKAIEPCSSCWAKRSMSMATASMAPCRPAVWCCSHGLPG